MNFGGAIVALQQGKRVRRDIWSNPKAHVTLERDRMMMNVGDGEAVLWAAPTRDMLANDWHEYPKVVRESYEQDRSACA